MLALGELLEFVDLALGWLFEDLLFEPFEASLHEYIIKILVAQVVNKGVIDLVRTRAIILNIKKRLDLRPLITLDVDTQVRTYEEQHCQFVLFLQTVLKKGELTVPL